MRQLVTAVALGGCALLGLAAACGSPASLQCRVAAVEFLPQDPGQITPYHVVDLVGRLKACEPAPVASAPSGDAGAR